MSGQCNTCLMNSSDLNLKIDENGKCNYCLEADKKMPHYIFSEEQVNQNLINMASDIKKRAGRNKYDCVVGLSGGVDSSFVAYLAKQMDLNPMCVHFDNGWNSEVAVSNIQKIVDKCGFDLFTYVINWPEFKDLQRSFFKAGVIDIEVLSDHAINATMVQIAKKHKIKNVLSGANYRTEHGMPKDWTWLKQDLKNIKAIQKRFGTKKIKEFPTLGVLKYSLIRLFALGGTYHLPLDKINYKKNEAMKILQEEFDWVYYGGKHYESVFTKFYQAYILPRKFKINKSIVHTSCLIRNNEISLKEGNALVNSEKYDEMELEQDYSFVIKKLGFTRDEFEKILNSEPIAHDFYPSNYPFFKRMEKIANLFNLR